MSLSSWSWHTHSRHGHPAKPVEPGPRFRPGSIYGSNSHRPEFNRKHKGRAGTAAGRALTMITPESKHALKPRARQRRETDGSIPSPAESITSGSQPHKRYRAGSNNGKYGWFDNSGFYNALDSTRQARELNWKQVSEQSGISSSTLTRIAQGKRPDVDGLAALAAWASLNTDDFMRSMTPKTTPEPLAMISTHLRSDPNLTPEAANTLDQVIKANYNLLSKIR